MRMPDFLPIEFIIIGGGVAGLTSAIALSRVGHRVTLLEADPTFKETNPAGGCRISPNATKVLYRWGMEKRLRDCAVKNTGTLFANYKTGSVVGLHEWEEEVLEETGGDVLLCYYADFRRILAESAQEHGAKLLTSSQVVGIHSDAQRPYVALASGEVLSADVIIGADGVFTPTPLCRKDFLLKSRKEEVVSAKPMQLFHAVIPEASVEKLSDVEMLRHLRKTGKVFCWYGPTYGAIGFPIKKQQTGEHCFTVFVYADSVGVVEPGQVSIDEFVQYLGDCDSRLLSLARGSEHILRLPMTTRPFLEDWADPHGRILVIGDAAHPTPTGSMYSIPLAVGDGAVLGRLFSHLHTKEQIPSFLRAVQEIREERVASVINSCEGNTSSLPPGVAEARAQQLRELQQRGSPRLGKLGSGAGERASMELIETIEGVFAYDPEDEADNWWVQWGLMEERAARIFDSTPIVVDTHDVQTSHRSSPSR